NVLECVGKNVVELALQRGTLDGCGEVGPDPGREWHTADRISCLPLPFARLGRRWLGLGGFRLVGEYELVFERALHGGGFQPVYQCPAFCHAPLPSLRFTWLTCVPAALVISLRMLLAT